MATRYEYKVINGVQVRVDLRTRWDKFIHGSNNYGWCTRFIVIFWIVTVLVVGGFITGLVTGINAISRQVAVESCHNWGLHTGRETRFISQNLFSYGCFTRANDGLWVSIEYPQQFIPLNVSNKAGH
jgi:hypothetical protein